MIQGLPLNLENCLAILAVDLKFSRISHHGNPQPVFLRVITHIKTFLFHGFGVQGHASFDTYPHGFFSTSLGSLPGWGGKPY